MYITNRTSSFFLILTIAATAAIACQSPRDKSGAKDPSTTNAVAAKAAPAQAVPARKWEHETSDIPVNPRIRFINFNNGMRFAWMTNAEPKNRCYVRLHVNVGSLAEEESERGMAHFLEHMCFNGSKNFAAGTLVEWFQKHGMSFGADTNASTGFDETIYQLDLPNSDVKILEEGLTVMRDFADGLLLAENEVTDEKGVIDAEERERDSAQFRVLVKSLGIQFTGTRVGDRLPIGIKSIRDKFSSASVRKFYQRWYRPENMTLVIVGDLKDLNPETLVRAKFEDLKVPATPLEPTPPVGKCTYAQKEFYIYDKELSSVNIGITMARPWVDRPENTRTAVEDIPVDFARRMVNLRFSELAKKKDAPFVNASAGDARGLSAQLGIRVEEGESLNITSQPELWEKALARCEKELRRAVEFGFDESELNEVRANALRGIDESVEREKTRSSGSWLQEILDAAENRSVVTTAEISRKIVRPAIEKLTPEVCHEAFKKAWSEGTLIIGGYGNIELSADGKRLREIYDESRSKEVKKREKKVEIPFGYSSDPAKAGDVVSKTQNAEFDFTEVTFKNNVKLRVKKTDFQNNQVIVQAAIGEGMLTRENPDILYGLMTPIIYNGGGLGKHSVDDLRKINAGKQVGAGLEMSDDSFVISGGTTSKDITRQFELMAALLTDPGFRDDGLQQIQKIIPILFDRLKHDVGTVMQFNLAKDLYNDPTKAFPPREAIESFTVDQIKTWIMPNLVDAPIDIVVVGDVDVDAVVAAASQTFGLLGPRRAMKRYEEHRKPVTIAMGKKFTYEAETEIPKVMIHIVYPTTDGREAATRRHMSWLGTLLSDRLRIDVREKLGATYSPRASATTSRIFPNDGFVAIDVESAPDKVDETIEACIASAERLAKGGITDDELNRAREPMVAQLRDAQRTNGYWLQNLAQLHTNPKSLDDLRTVKSFIDNLKPADLAPLAAKYLTRDRATVFVAKPVKPASAPAK